jgi:hypothetical protein
VNDFVETFYGMFLLVISQEEILGFSAIQIHCVFSQMGQSSLICNLHGFGFEKKLIKTYLVKHFFVVLGIDMLHN